jgi:hypothetical protein
VPDVVAQLDVPRLRHEHLADLAGLEYSMARMVEGRLRDCVPSCTIRLLRRAASITRRLSRMLWEPGFSIDVLAGVAREDGGRRVPVVRRRDRDGLDLLVVEELRMSAVVLAAGRLSVHERLRLLERSLVGVAQVGDARRQERGKLAHQGAPGPPAPIMPMLISSLAAMAIRGAATAAAAAAPRKNLRFTDIMPPFRAGI